MKRFLTFPLFPLGNGCGRLKRGFSTHTRTGDLSPDPVMHSPLGRIKQRKTCCFIHRGVWGGCRACQGLPYGVSVPLPLDMQSTQWRTSALCSFAGSFHARPLFLYGHEIRVTLFCCLGYAAAVKKNRAAGQQFQTTRPF